MATIASSITGNLTAVRPPQLTELDELLCLQKAAHKISSILDLDQLIDKVVNDVARSFGCVEADVYLHDEARGVLVLARANGCAGCEVCGAGHSLRIGKDGMVGYVAGTGQMRYAPDVRKDPYYIGCEESTLSEVAIPLHVDGKLIGVFTGSHPELDAFPVGDLRLLQALCAHVAVAVHNARRFQEVHHERETLSREANEARKIQQALLPRSSPYIPGFSVSGLSTPASAVGGDWYDFIPFDDGRWGLVLADVSGKGTAAALLMSATRGMVRSLADACSSPSEVLTKLNDLMVSDFPSGRFVTMIYGVLDPATRSLKFASAGHLRPLLLETSGARFLDTERGLPLGIGAGEYSEASVQLLEGSRLLFYSDGITEATGCDDEEYGAGRLEKHFRQAEVSADSILQDVRTFANGAGLHDDATVILVKA